MHSCCFYVCYNLQILFKNFSVYLKLYLDENFSSLCRTFGVSEKLSQYKDFQILQIYKNIYCLYCWFVEQEVVVVEEEGVVVIVIVVYG